MIYRGYSISCGLVFSDIAPHPGDVARGEGLFVGDRLVHFVMDTPPPQEQDRYRWFELDALGWALIVCPPPDEPADEVPALVHTTDDEVVYLPGTECVMDGRYGALVIVQPDAVIRTRESGMTLDYVYTGGLLRRVT